MLFAIYNSSCAKLAKFLAQPNREMPAIEIVLKTYAPALMA
jgi:hypothetical protein